MVKYISVAGNTEVYDQLNELEYYNGFVYANVWQKPYILKINPKSSNLVYQGLYKICSFCAH